MYPSNDPDRLLAAIDTILSEAPTAEVIADCETIAARLASKYPKSGMSPWQIANRIIDRSAEIGLKAYP
ncbi:MAG: hypothetical protein AB7S41_11790 [Parvibaculaceae bacterium]